MASVYVLSDNGKISRTGETLVFTQPDGTKTIVFPFKTESLMLIGSVSLTGEAIRLIARHRIPVIFLASNGKFNGKLVYGVGKNVFLRQKQYLIAADEQQSLAIAGCIVAGKIRNQLSFMQRIKRKTKAEESSVRNAITGIKNILMSLPEVSDKDKLRGMEGLASRYYFQVFKYNLLPDWAVFEKRSRNPPGSNVNAVLSFLYTLLMYRVEAAIETLGLDSMVGNLHLMNYGAQSLVFDLMEEFRIPIADTVCCSLFNLGQLEPEDFRTCDFSSDDSDLPLHPGEESDTEEKSNTTGVLLTKDGIKKVIKAFETKMESCVLYAPDNEKISFQQIIIRQCRQYKRIIAGDQLVYEPFYFK